jgi:hypothetical protein
MLRKLRIAVLWSAFVWSGATLGALALAGCSTGPGSFYVYQDDGTLDPNCPAAALMRTLNMIPLYGTVAASAVGLVGAGIALVKGKKTDATVAANSAKIDAHVADAHGSDGICNTCGAAVTVTAAALDPAAPIVPTPPIAPAAPGVPVV